MQTISNQPVVFLSPTFPAFRGNGLAMRAAATLHLLSQWSSEVHLLVIPIYNRGIEAPEPEIAQLCRSWHSISNPDPCAVNVEMTEWLDSISDPNVAPPEWQGYNSSWQTEFDAVIDRLHPGLIVVFRFYLAPFVLRSACAKVPVWLDLDELESTSRARLSHVYTLAGRKREAHEMRLQAMAYEKLELHYLRRFERIFAASNTEATGTLARCAGARIDLLPNVYPVIRPQPPREMDGTARFLYVGTLGYYPNQDAVEYFCRDVLPSIRARSPVPVEVTVIGSTQSLVGESSSISGVNFAGPVADTTPYYAECDAAIVPLRAAGGTRIKILEAFSHQRAVVSTSIGAEGLDITNGVHLHIADGAEIFADHCLQLICDAEGRHALAERGHQLFLDRHTLPRLEATIPRLFGEWSSAR